MRANALVPLKNVCTLHPYEPTPYTTSEWFVNKTSLITTCITAEHPVFLKGNIPKGVKKNSISRVSYLALSVKTIYRIANIRHVVGLIFYVVVLLQIHPAGTQLIVCQVKSNIHNRFYIDINGQNLRRIFIFRGYFPFLYFFSIKV